MSKAKDYAKKMGYRIDEKMTLDFQERLRLGKKKPVTIRLPEDVIEAFRDLSGDDVKYQALMREVLTDYVEKKKKIS